VWWHGEPDYGEGEAQGSGGIASRGPEAAINREEEVREGRKATDHGGRITAVLTPASCAWQHRSGREHQGIGLGIG
jgi:hypothetical protein